MPGSQWVKIKRNKTISRCTETSAARVHSDPRRAQPQSCSSGDRGRRERRALMMWASTSRSILMISVLVS